MKKSNLLLCVLMAFLFTSCNGKTNQSQSSDLNAQDKYTFSVLNFTPQDELPSSVKCPSIQIQFSKPVVALERLGVPSEKSEIFKIEPELKGVYRWYGTSVLSLEASDAIIPLKEYTVTVNSEVKSIDGDKIEGPLVYKFHTEELKLTSVIAAYKLVEKGVYVDTEELPLEDGRYFALYFNYPVNAKVVSKYIEVNAGEEKTAFSVSKGKNENSIFLTLDKELPFDTKINIVLKKGAMADLNTYATSEDEIYKFSSLSDLEIKTFRDSYSWGYSENEAVNPVEFVFNHLIKEKSEEEIAKCVLTEPEMQVTKDNILILGKMVVVHSLPVTFGSEYTITMKAGVKDEYGLSLKKDESHKVKVPEAASFVRFKDYGTKILEAQFDPKMAFMVQNILPEDSSYTIKPLANATGKSTDKKLKVTYFADKEIPANTKYIEVVNLKPFLEYTDQGFRGALNFKSKIYYKNKYYNWQKNATEEKVADDNHEQNILVTDLAMTIRYAYDSAVVMVTKLSDGKAVKGALVKAYVNSTKDSFPIYNLSSLPKIAESVTDENGLAVLYSKEDGFAVSDGSYNSRNNILFEAVTENDRTVTPGDSVSMWRTGASSISSPSRVAKNQIKTFVFTDRGLYKPGEKLTFRGIQRNLKKGRYSVNKDDVEIKITDGVWDPKIYKEMTLDVSDNGTFWGEFSIPEDMVPGVYSIVTADEYKYYKTLCTFQVQFFERLKFEASTKIADIDYYRGDKINAEVSASYLGGGSLSGSTAQTWWLREPCGFAPKNNKSLEGLRFGPLLGYDGRTTLSNSTGVINGEGKLTVSQTSGGETLKGMAYSYRVETNVTDSGGQMISTSASALVHPAKYYIGLSKITNSKGFPKKGDTVKFNYICVKPDGSTPSQKDLYSSKTLKVELLRENWKSVQQIGWNGQINTRYEREMITEVEKTMPLNVSGHFSEVAVTVPKGGEYLIRLSAKDNKGNDVVTESRFYVISSDWYWWNRDSAEEITMTTDKDLYVVGEKAQILMQSPLEKGRYMMTIEREGIYEQKILDIKEQTSIIEVDVRDEYVPVMYVTLSSYSVRKGQPVHDFNTSDLDKPKSYFGLAAIHVDSSLEKFDVKITADKPSYRPAEKAKIKLHAQKDGKAVSNAEITLMAVDRGVIDLINYHVPDPVEFFYDEYNFPDAVKGSDTRSYLMDPVTYEIRNQFGGDSVSSTKDELQTRKNFEPTALFIPNLVTDENGDVEVEFTLPDSLTAYRITAIGVKENKFSINEDEMKVANPLSVRDVLPRKLRLDDCGEFGVTISNLDTIAHDVTVTANLYDGIEKAGLSQNEDEVQKLSGHAVMKSQITKMTSIAADRTTSLMFMAEAKKSGWITIEFIVKSDIVNERILKTLEIEKPYIYETVSTAGEVRSEEKSESKIASAKELLVLPSDIDEGKGTLTIQLDPTHLGDLREAVDYCFHYPYYCMEQRASAMLPLVAFGEYVDAFGLKNEVKNVKGVIKSELKKWAKVQKPDGGFPYWPDGYIENEYVSVRIGEIAAIAEEKKMLPSSSINVATLKSYIADKARENNADSYYDLYRKAYAYYVLSRLGASVSDSEIQKLVDSKYADVESLAYCGLAFVAKKNIDKAKEVAIKIRRQTKITTRGIDITPRSNRSLWWSFYNDNAECLALLLQLYTQVDKTDTINGHLVYQLLSIEKSQKGYWKSTAVTSRVLVAMDEYIRSNDLTDTNFTAEVLLNGQKCLEGKFKGTAALSESKIFDFGQKPLSELKTNEEIPLEFNKDGNGILYYTMAMKYALPLSQQTARDEGICIYSEITDVESGEVVFANKLEAGKIYRQSLHISTTKNRNYVALRVPVPAGCEIMNAAFVTTGFVAPKEQKKPDAEISTYDEDGLLYTDYKYYTYGLANQEIYDSEVQYFWDFMNRGSQTVDFLFRAVRKGTYTLPSASAECMYEEEIFGRTAGKVIKIE